MLCRLPGPSFPLKVKGNFHKSFIRGVCLDPQGAGGVKENIYLKMFYLQCINALDL